MTLQSIKTQECIHLSKEILGIQKSLLEDHTKEGDPGIRVPERLTLKDLTQALKGFNIPDSQIKTLTSSSSARREYIRKNDVFRWGDTAQLIGKGSDIKQIMKDSMQSGAGGPKDILVQVQAVIMAYEGSHHKLSQYALMNAIFRTNVNTDTLVLYGGEKMTYWEAQKKQISTYVEDNIDLLKNACEGKQTIKI